jgi:hypothetical protein
MVRRRLGRWWLWVTAMTLMACAGHEKTQGSSEEGSAGDDEGDGGLPGKGWTSRRKITFAEDVLELGLTDIPIMLRLNESRVMYDSIDEFVPDIRFYDGTLETELPYEIERWIHGSQSIVWVRVASIDKSTAGRSIYLYYGKSDLDEGHAPQDVWEDYRAVWHMNRDDEGKMPDASGNGHDGILSGGGAMSSTTDLAGPALSISASASYLEIPHAPELVPGQSFTIEGWINADIIDDQPRFLVRKRDSYAIEASSEGEGTPRGVVWFETSADRSVSAPTALEENRYTHLALVYDGASTTFAFFIDGKSAVEREPPSDPAASSETAVEIGLEAYGLIDEVRISDVVRSPAWLTVQRRAMLDDLLTFGPAEYPG